MLLDTTYLLPAIGISVKGLPNDTPIKLMEKGNKICISDITIFELSAKGAKHINAGTLPIERVTKGIKTIAYDETVTTIPIYEGIILPTAFKLRSILNDFIDCLILSSAINQCDILITEDNDIQDLKENKEFRGLLMTINSKFQIQTLAEYCNLRETS